MPTLTLIEHNGTAHQVTGDIGQSVMQAATFASVPGISADCGGACSCATCHTYVDEAWLSTVQAAEGMENDMLEYAFERRDNSRLSCQLIISQEMDGMVLHLPSSQF
ncbi:MULTISPECIES: 2Fe-2S iron-sulfur cluster-binding protein [Pseudomonas]|jgi:2Fe-2S ferredoxin|uniref:Ferredoxin-6 n=2 Tax=Pseudomonas fluorescens group TaxID=136843 RepID=A0A5E6P9G8_PSEFL|nr:MULTISPECIES: 2Fe-2S iron-sulfur cluster-binding protein [Pseudomonas]OPK06599.1 (2Fe-2S)-binding protein [Pseudomonas sp. VI4.1]CAG8864223.1 Ferredoxin-6 [Pseudomonas fluorescens]VVM39751.1 Ferredoxin-6 [Pseudomonas fluorescens]VVP92993.1 Ferredoxin-6 [Pseudomonas fluorescens]VVQ05176.1 Ferredoxin-6 [Pseudomonas fluorescens]